MIIYHLLIAALWLVLIAYWALAAVGAKRTIKSGWVWWRELGLRLAIFVLILIVLRIPGTNRWLQDARSFAVNTNIPLGYAGAVLCALGVGFAIWARVHLGRNWGLPMSQKENPDFITTGPYAYVRHPIYGGLLLAMLGSAIGQSVLWLIPLIVGTVYFVDSARREERVMLEQFPARYAAYQARSRRFIPFVW